MSIGSVGTRSQISIQSLVDMRARLDALQQQLTSGKKADTYAGMGADRGLGVTLRSQLAALGGYDQTITMVGLRLNVAQTALTRIDAIGQTVKSGALQAGALNADGKTIAQETARTSLDELMDLLNTKAGDRSVFGGRATDRPAVEKADHILNGDGARAGLTQIIDERKQADLGANGLGRLVIPPAAGATVSISENAAGSPFGFKLASVTSTLSGATVTGPSGSPPAASVALTSNPVAGESVTFNFNLPDGTTQALTLTATNATPPGAGQFAIGATPADTATNLQAALTTGVGYQARTTLTAASAVAAADNFFNTDTTHPPLRVAGPPFTSATALTAGTAANTVSWYTGEMASGPARSSATARIDDSITVNYGVRANEQGIRRLVQSVALFATATNDPSDPESTARYTALAARTSAALAPPPGQQKVNDILSDIASAQGTLSTATDRHKQTSSALSGMIDSIENVSPEEVGAQILALQTRLQASLQTTALLYRTSLVNYL
jgi:flagellin-like hook-associated protein FlgL